jgi:hypothetical protein
MNMAAVNNNQRPRKGCWVCPVAESGGYTHALLRHELCRRLVQRFIKPT